jgi:hypothetical protein
MDIIFASTAQIFNVNQTKPNTEIEFRLGKINKQMFDTNVGKDVFTRIMSGLRKYKEWENVVETNTSVYYKGNTRIIVNDDNEDDIIKMEKVNVSKTDFKLEKNIMDVRLAVSTETALFPDAGSGSDDGVMDSIRTKHRVSFIRKNLSIDMTVVQGDTCDMDDEEENRYEIELEIINLNFIKDDKELYNLVHKIFDILKIVE